MLSFSFEVIQATTPSLARPWLTSSTESNTPPLARRLLPKLIQILEQDSRDPAAPASLSVKLLGPVPFDRALALAPEESLITALRSPEPSVNLLAMAVLEKAARTRDDAALLAKMPRLVAELLHRWLLSPHAQVGAKGRRVLGDLLDTDCELPPPPASSVEVQTDIVRRRAPGLGAVWRLLFRDRDTYRLLLDICSGRHPDTAAADAQQLSLAQGRLLDILPRLAVLNLRVVSESDIPAGRPAHATNGGGHTDDEPGAGRLGNDGLLQFAALRMVDKKDRLMHLNLVTFFEGFVSLMRATEHSPYKLETLRALLREATADDEMLKTALVGLPDRTVPEEADELRGWLQQVLPGESVRIAGHWS